MFIKNLLKLTERGQYPREQAPPRDAERVFSVLIHKCILGLRQVTNF